MVQTVKNLPAMQETQVRSLGWEDPLEKGMATHSSILAWRIPWIEESMGWQRVGHDLATNTSLHFLYTYSWCTLLCTETNTQCKATVFLQNIFFSKKQVAWKEQMLLYKWRTAWSSILVLVEPTQRETQKASDWQHGTHRWWFDLVVFFFFYNFSRNKWGWIWC